LEDIEVLGYRSEPFELCQMAFCDGEANVWQSWCVLAWIAGRSTSAADGFSKTTSAVAADLNELISAQRSFEQLSSAFELVELGS
jgi:hypothetical protein